MLVGFIREYKDICPKFANYCKNVYASGTVKCVMCYRQFEQANTGTNMLIESFHNKLK